MNGENDTMYYEHKDYLGSYDVITDEQGHIMGRYSFDSWGRRRNPADWTYNNIPSPHLFDRGYTGHEHLDIFGLINMNGRVYDPWLSRFLSPDPFVQTPTHSQSFNRYSYCLNNPLKYVDPSGYKRKPFFEWESNATYYGGGGFNGRIGPGSGNHWSDGLGSTFGNFMMMDQQTFVNFYGQGKYNGIFENYVNTQETPASDDSFNGAIYYLNLDYGGWAPVAVVDAEGNRLTIVESLEGEGNSINYYLHFIENYQDAENGGIDGLSGIPKIDALKYGVAGTSVFTNTIKGGFDAARVTQKTFSTWSKGARVLGRTSNILTAATVTYDFATGTANTSTLVNAGVTVVGASVIFAVGIAAAPCVVVGGVIYGIVSLAGGDNWLNSHFDISDKINFIKRNGH